MAWSSREQIIAELKRLGRNYNNYDRFSDRVLYGMMRTEQQRAAKKKAAQPAAMQSTAEIEIPRKCKRCGGQLTDGGQCPRCDFGDDDFEDDISWVNI